MEVFVEIGYKWLDDGQQVLLVLLCVLVAEDNVINCIVLGVLFKFMGVELVFVENGCEVVEMFCKEFFDVILMDVMMLEMSGFEVMQIIWCLEKDVGVKLVLIYVFIVNLMCEQVV